MHYLRIGLTVVQSHRREQWSEKVSDHTDTSDTTKAMRSESQVTNSTSKKQSANNNIMRESVARMVEIRVSSNKGQMTKGKEQRANDLEQRAKGK
jgi:hypothetical protein